MPTLATEESDDEPKKPKKERSDDVKTQSQHPTRKQTVTNQDWMCTTDDVAEWFWEAAKREGRKEFESGHLAANITFPVGYMKGLWNIARYLGVRESFINEWNPRGGIEVSFIDMMAQSYFQWQFWLEETVKRSQTREHEEHPEYSKWKARRKEENKLYGIQEGYWFRPLVSEKEAV